MTKALYVRTSTKDQDGAAQLHALKQAATARGWVDVREFVDLGVSGARARRPALDELRRAARHGNVDGVLVVGLDRLGRSLTDLLALLGELSSSGCAVASLREGIDLGTPAGRLQVQLLGAFAEFERALIQERVRAGMERARKEGTRSGRAIGRPRRRLDASVVGDALAHHGSVAAAARALGVPRATFQRAAQKGARQDGATAAP
jgi:DNA invertase Pin-like site-specific DNA recombinase